MNQNGSGERNRVFMGLPVNMDTAGQLEDAVVVDLSDLGIRPLSSSSRVEGISMARVVAQKVSERAPKKRSGRKS